MRKTDDFFTHLKNGRNYTVTPLLVKRREILALQIHILNRSMASV